MAPDDLPVEEQWGYIELRIQALRDEYEYSPKLQKFGHIYNDSNLLTPAAMRKAIVTHCRRRNVWHVYETEQREEIVRAVLKMIRDDSKARLKKGAKPCP